MKERSKKKIKYTYIRSPYYEPSSLKLSNNTQPKLCIVYAYRWDIYYQIHIHIQVNPTFQTILLIVFIFRKILISHK